MQLLARDKVHLNINNLEIMEFVKLTSKIIGKNILIDQKINGRIEFEQNEPLYEDEILDILIYVLESKGFTIVQNGRMLRLVKLINASKYNVPVYNNIKKLKSSGMVTKVFQVEYSNVDYIAVKVKHLMSKTGKLVTDKNSNSLVLTDFSSNIETIQNVVNIISKDAKKSIEIVKLENLNGEVVQKDLINVEKSVFNGKVLNENVEIILNKDTNSIMFVGKKDNVDFMVKYLKELDTTNSLAQKIVEVIYLKNAESKDVLTILNALISKKTYKDINEKPFASTYQESNSLILMGTKPEIEYFKTIINKLDIDRQQVYVKAKIIEISELKTKDIGIKYGISGFSSGNMGLASFASSLNSGGNVPSVDLTALSTYGFNLATMSKALSLGATISLLNQNQAADIVSEPSLLCINNKESSIYVGETRSIKTGTATTTGGTINDTYKREDIGLTLKVKPRISNGNKVSLDISTKLEDVGQTTTNDQPNTYKKDLVTTAIVNNGESIILGGYIKSKSEYTTDKLPVLGDIPIVGNLFQNNYKVQDKINLVIIITPYIVPKTKDLTYVRDQLAQLKILEEKYTKDLILKLEKDKINSIQQDIKRQKDIKEVQEEKTELLDYLKDITSKPQPNSHQDKINSMFGL
jgi:general secretion pathway protein D